MKHLVALAAAAVALAATPPRTMYMDALARERAVRPALAAPDALATILIDVRAVIGAYEAITRRHPASGYSDDALWNGGRLALDAYVKFGQPQDRDTAIRLLNKLTAAYPGSKLVKLVPEQLARVTASGETPPRIATIRDIRRTVSADGVRITIELDGEAAFHDEHIGNPERVFVDLTNARAAPGLVDQTIRFHSDDDIVRQVRIGRHPNHTTRVVVEAAGISSYSVYPLSSPFRVVIDCVRGNADAKGIDAAPKLLGGHTVAPGFMRVMPGVTPRGSRLIANATATGEPSGTSGTAPPTVSPSIPALPAVSPSTGFSIARQLGVGVSRIVIDPGHGGHDPGAKGRGVVEAELVLDVALRLEKLLQKGGMEVILTRREDEFVALQDRPAIANREAADLFLSIHANASSTAIARGIETYFLNFATNPNAAQVAARENAASALSMGTVPDVVKAIALNTKVDESREFAAHVQRAMVDRLRAGNKGVKDLGVKQAPFIVLIGATMPSVLAEISFVTNVQEAKLLKGNAYRQRIAEALFNGITRYQVSLKNVTTVAPQ